MSYTLCKNNPIGIFDSGLGGISVLRELVRIMPSEDFIYLGDSLHAPYGTKTLEEVRQRSIENAEFLFDKGAKGLVVACNTATSAAVRLLREMYPYIPIVGIEPAVKPAVNCMEHPKVLVMATPMTIREEKFHKLMDRYKEQGEIIPLPCPGLMNFVERGDFDGEDLEKYLSELLFEYKHNKVDAVVLGCTHYPFVKSMISKVLGGDVLLFDGGEGTAREMKRRLGASDLLTDKNQKGKVEFINTIPGEEKINLCKNLFFSK